MTPLPHVLRWPVFRRISMASRRLAVRKPERRPRSMRRCVRVLAMTGLATLCGSFGVAARAQQTRTANDRVYSDAQAKRGQALYQERCASCHGGALQGGSGPPLPGDEFIAVWGKQPLSDLVGKILNPMPANDPGKLTRQQSADLVGHILHAGAFPAGQAELGTDEAALKLITLPPAHVS